MKRSEPDRAPPALSHVDREGHARMVDVSRKPVTERRAVAEGYLVADPRVLGAIGEGETPKGNLYETARIAGIQAAKRTHELVPLCHVLPLDHVDVRFEPAGDRIRIEASAKARASTGVEMEALTACTVAALTLYDMLKALSKALRIEGIRLLEKTGGKSGAFRADDR